MPQYDEGPGAVITRRRGRPVARTEPWNEPDLTVPELPVVPGPAALPVTGPVAPAAPAPWAGVDYSKPFAEIPGFDFGKLQTQGRGTPAKYTDAVRTFSQGIASLGTPRRNNLEPHVAYARANGFPNARSTSDDKIDFGDGNGPIDIIRAGSDAVWFQNGQDRLGAPAGEVASPAKGAFSDWSPAPVARPANAGYVPGVGVAGMGTALSGGFGGGSEREFYNALLAHAGTGAERRPSPISPQMQQGFSDALMGLQGKLRNKGY